MYKRLEEELKQSLIVRHGEGPGNNFYSQYSTAKENITKILKDIPAAEPRLTGHDINHVNRVLANVCNLLGDKVSDLNWAELYLLAMAVLFHDSGNIFGREEHQNKISSVFNDVRGTDESIRSEKKIISGIVSAHGGKAMDGSSDTLNDVPDRDHYGGEIIRMRDIAAIIRFADELDEHPDRASEFRLKHSLIDKESQIYHEYAKSAEITIDKPGNRIVLRCNITVSQDETLFRNFLDFGLYRIAKLDYERQYTKYHSEYLAPYKKLEVTLNFWDQENKHLDENTHSFVLTDQPIDQPMLEMRKSKGLIDKPETIICDLKGHHPFLFKLTPQKMHVGICQKLLNLLRKNKL